MEQAFYTIHEFMLHSENITYIIMGISLLAILGFISFLTGRDDD